MPNYTLYYFNGRGRAEICRMMFAAAGIKYTDKRFEFSEWDRYRKDFPCNYLPCLEMDGGFRMPETMSICRYIARQYGFYPKSPMDIFRCDYICDCFYEIMHDYMRYYHWKNGRFRCDFMDNGMMGSNMSSGMMGSNMSSGMMGSNMSSGMMGSNMSSGMMGSNMSSGMMGSNMSPGMMGSNMSSGMMGSNMSSGMMGDMSPTMMGSNMSPAMMGSSMGSSMMGSDMSSGMSSGMMSPGMEMGSDMCSNMGGSSCNYDNYMYWRYMNSFNRIMPFMERSLSMRNGGSKFFMGDHMMWCDMMFYCCMENMYMQNQSMFSNYPKMMALYNRVATHPKICSYLKGRCKSNW